MKLFSRAWVVAVVLILDVAAAIVVLVLLSQFGELSGDATLLVIAFALVAPALLLAWLLPRWQADRSDLTGKDRHDFENEARRTVIQLLGAAGLILTVAVTLLQLGRDREDSQRSFELADEGSLTDRFTQAVELLGARDDNGPVVELRIGGIYALRAFSTRSDGTRLTTSDILTAYLRANARRLEERPVYPSADPCASDLARREDIRAAASVLNDLHQLEEGAPPTFLDLQGADLSGLRFGGFNLQEADLSDAVLVQAQFFDSDLRSARLEHVDGQDACFSGAKMQNARFSPGAYVTPRVRRQQAARLQGASFADADLRDAELAYVDLTSASLAGASLAGADLRGADLSKAYVEGATFDGACVDEAKMGSLVGSVASAEGLQGRPHSLAPGFGSEGNC